MEAISPSTSELISRAIREDVGTGDLTTEALIPEEMIARAQIIAKEALVVCGQAVAREVFRQIDSRIHYVPQLADGASALDNQVLAQISGPMRGILSGERVALNFLQRLSGIATKTNLAVQQLEHTTTRVLDTRKTTPGWRELEKYAVRTGGGTNHRIGLFDAVLIKNNHIDAFGGDVRLAVGKAREAVAPGVKVQVEVRDTHELELAIEGRPDSILLDNMTPELVAQSVELIRARQPNIKIEASGGIRIHNLAQYAQTGVDYISLGEITHSAPASDISLRFWDS